MEGWLVVKTSQLPKILPMNNFSDVGLTLTVLRRLPPLRSNDWLGRGQLGISSRYIWWKAWTPFSCFTL
jgi:hypothetical protein